MQIVNLEYV